MGANRALSACVASALAIGVGVGAYWFQPWKAVVDARVNDAVAPEAKVLKEGRFRSLEHETRGTAKVLQSPGGGRVLRFEDLETSNGPLLVVMLSATPATEDGWSAYDDGKHLILEPLKGNVGSQNYALPDHVDLAEYRSAVVWCNRFSVAFGAAPIE